MSALALEPGQIMASHYQADPPAITAWVTCSVGRRGKTVRHELSPFQKVRLPAEIFRVVLDCRPFDEQPITGNTPKRKRPGKSARNSSMRVGAVAQDK